MRFEVSSDLNQKDLKNYSHLWRFGVKRADTMRYLALIVILFILTLFLTISAEGTILDGMRRFSVIWALVIASAWSYYAQIRISDRGLGVLLRTKPLRIFTDEAIESVLTNAYQRFSYSTVSAVYHSKGTYYLLLTLNTVMILPERCFTQGDPAAFGAFVTEKTGLEIKEIK